MASPEQTSVLIPAFNEARAIGAVVRGLVRGWRLARDPRRRRRLGGRHARSRGGGGRPRDPAPVQQGQRRVGQERHSRGRGRVRADHRRRRPAPAGGRRAARRAARRVRPRHRRARRVRRRRRLAPARRQCRAEPPGELPDRPADSRSDVRVPAARRECLREFLHLLPNRFSTPTTTTLAFVKAGYSVAFVPVEARSRVGSLEDPARCATARSSC